MDCAAGPEERSTGEVPRLQKFFRRNCWVFLAPRKSERYLTVESAECCRRRGSSHLPGREAPAQTATGEPGMPLWTWDALRWVANGVRVVPVWYDHGVACQWSSVQWRSVYARLQVSVCSSYSLCQTQTDSIWPAYMSSSGCWAKTYLTVVCGFWNKILCDGVLYENIEVCCLYNQWLHSEVDNCYGC